MRDRLGFNISTSQINATSIIVITTQGKRIMIESRLIKETYINLKVTIRVRLVQRKMYVLKLSDRLKNCINRVNSNRTASKKHFIMHENRYRKLRHRNVSEKISIVKWQTYIENILKQWMLIT